MKEYKNNELNNLISGKMLVKKKVAAAYLSISVATLDRMRKDNEIKSIQLLKLVIIKQNILHFIKKEKEL